MNHEGDRAPETAARMVAAARAFVATLDERRRAAVSFAFEDEERFRWDYRPSGFFIRQHTFWHEGLRLANMTPPQKAAAFALLASGLSEQGLARVRAIMALETGLRETERFERWIEHVVRDPELYAFGIFGEPGSERWSWRVGGHHVAVHFTIVGGERISGMPLFLGANPAELRHGEQRGLRTMPEEEDLARALLGALSPENRGRAIVGAEAPGDILTDVRRAVRPDDVPSGLLFGQMSPDEQEKTMRLARWYTDRSAAEIAGSHWRRIEADGLDAVSFAWLGGTEAGEPHYYALRGPSFVIEYDKTQDGANHVHSVLRSFAGDWGEDLLAAHYRTQHRVE